MIALGKPKNPNYAASIVEVKTLKPIPKAEKVQVAVLYGNSVIVGIDTKIGDKVLFFPVECAISQEILASNNLYRKNVGLNKDTDSPGGYFEQSGRVKCIKFLGQKSEGVALPLESLACFGVDPNDIPVGVDFDFIVGNEVCRKYVPRVNPGRLSTNQPKKKRAEDRIIDGQFKFHFDTENLRRNIHQIDIDDTVSISKKLHGTSAVFSNVLVERELSWYEKIMDLIGLPVQKSKYGFVWSSRKVVKGIDGIEKEGTNHYYGSDVWGHVAKTVEPNLPKGYTVYGEIVGYTPEGGAIQSMKDKVFDYGCKPGQHKFFVYRATVTNADGVVVELSWPQLREFCEVYEFNLVPELYYGSIGEWLDDHVRYGLWKAITEKTLLEHGEAKYDNESRDEAFRQLLLEKLEEYYVHDQDCDLCSTGVPAEGIVLRKDCLRKAESFKLKSFRFLRSESEDLDEGKADIETEEAEGASE